MPLPSQVPAPEITILLTSVTTGRFACSRSPYQWNSHILLCSLLSMAPVTLAPVAEWRDDQVFFIVELYSILQKSFLC